MKKYRYDDAYGKLYEYSEDHDAYLFVCCNPFGITEDELIADYENEGLYGYEEYGMRGL